MNEVNELLVNLNSWDKFGSVFVSDYEDVKGSFEDYEGFELKVDDIVIGYDWMDDEMSEDEKERFQSWLWSRFFNRLEREMNMLGYVRLDIDMDGSGNGLYYGMEVFRKK